MRYREQFTVFKRTMKSGRVIWYYQTYDEDGKRTTARSTGQTCKSAARNHCYKLLIAGTLIPNDRGRITFLKYSENWWIWDKCEYIAYRSCRRTISQGYARNSLGYMKKHLIPAFGDIRLKDIKTYDIEKWLQSFAEKGLSNQTANLTLSILRVMLQDAVRRGLLENDPSQAIAKLKNTAVPRGILSEKMVSRIFNIKKIRETWGHELYYTFNLTAAFTGMRLSEIRGIQTKNVHDGYIYVENQYYREFGLTDTKTHKSRNIPIPEILEKQLDQLKTTDPESFLFSLEKDRSKPIRDQTVRDAFHNALENQGMPREEQKEKNILFHSWRHYFNTQMIRNNIPEHKIRMMTGHSSAAMTEHYTHLDKSDLEEVKEIQNRIINFPSKVG